MSLRLCGLAMALAFGVPPVAAQTGSVPSTAASGVTTAPVRPPPPAVPLAPARVDPTLPPIVTERKVDLHSPPGPPEDLQAARAEAIAALQWARTEGCRDAAVPRDCVRRAEEDYRAVVGRKPR